VLDVWYGINAATQQSATAGVAGYKELPCRTVPQGTKDYRLSMNTVVRRSADMVILYDGLWMNASIGTAFRINGRHANRRYTNILFFDGHAGTYDRKSLPMDTNDFTLAKLNNPPFNVVKWRIDQR
jgi:prepilin-type processing-associated H-X9-DG protein